MATIVYANNLNNKDKDNVINYEVLQSEFLPASDIQKKLQAQNKKIAYFFIDPLLDYFEAGNRFYFKVLAGAKIDKINCYRTGAGPIHAFKDAIQFIDHNLCDAVFIFGYEPLLANKKMYGNVAIQKAMEIFDGPNLPKCYNELALLLCEQFGITKENFTKLANELYCNYKRTYEKNTRQKIEVNRGYYLSALGAPLFKLTDCANPNVNFAGGVILCNDKSCSLLDIDTEERIKVKHAQIATVEADPNALEKIVGSKDNIFPHLRELFANMQINSQLDIVAEFKKSNLLLDVYTCYPPTPIAFLLAGGFIENVKEFERFLQTYEITITGGMSLAGAPWNNPVLNSSVFMYKKLCECDAKYGLVHGNGGIGEAQGLLLLEKCKYDF